MQQINFNNWYQQMAEKIESFDIRQGRPFNFHTQEYALRFHQLSTNFGCNHFTTNLYLHFRYTFHAFGMRNVKKNYEFVPLYAPKDATSSLSWMTNTKKKNDKHRQRSIRRKKTKHKRTHWMPKIMSTFSSTESTVSINCLYCQLHSNDDSTSCSRLSAGARSFFFSIGRLLLLNVEKC